MADQHEESQQQRQPFRLPPQPYSPAAHFTPQHQNQSYLNSSGQTYNETYSHPSAIQSYPTYQQTQHDYHLPRPNQADHQWNNYQGTVNGGVMGAGYGYSGHQLQNMLQQQSNYQQMPHNYSYTTSSPSSSSSGPIHAVKSPQPYFSDSTNRSMMNSTYKSSNHPNDQRNRERSRPGISSPSLATLPARPDSAIRAVQLDQSLDSAVSVAESLPPSAFKGNSSRINVGPSTAYQHTIGPPSLPPPPAPTVPFSSRFPPLPPKPTPVDGDTISKEELMKQYEAREEALILRVEALGFEPEAAWRALQELEGNTVNDGERRDEAVDENNGREKPSSILGIRLLQKIDLLQRENEELESIFGKKLKLKEEESEMEGEREKARGKSEWLGD
jgi:hypothetical protein